MLSIIGLVVIIWAIGAIGTYISIEVISHRKGDPTFFSTFKSTVGRFLALLCVFIFWPLLLFAVFKESK
jgi:hypothetical protein